MPDLPNPHDDPSTALRAGFRATFARRAEGTVTVDVEVGEFRGSG
jgi:hypothetical protein